MNKPQHSLNILWELNTHSVWILVSTISFCKIELSHSARPFAFKPLAAKQRNQYYRKLNTGYINWTNRVGG